MSGEGIVPVTEEKQAVFSYGKLGFPCEIFHDDIYKFHDGKINWHWQRELEFSYIYKGSVELYILEEKHLIKEGEGYVILPDYMHCITNISHEEGLYDTIYVDPDFIFGKQTYVLFQKYYMSICNIINNGVIFFSIKEKWGAELVEELKNISYLLESTPPYYEIDVNRKLLNIWKIILENTDDENMGKKPISRNVESKIKEMICFIQANYGKKIYLEDIALSANIGKGECCRLFKTYLCTTPIKYLMEYRIEQSISMLLDGNDTITEIAMDVGFNSINHYIDTFKKITGTTPYKYKLGIENMVNEITEKPSGLRPRL
jgi:AraC-like DNA-binding protein